MRGFIRLCIRPAGLGGVKQILATPPGNEAGNSIYKEVSTVLSWPIKFKEHFTIEPSISGLQRVQFCQLSAPDWIPGNSAATTEAAGGSVSGTRKYGSLAWAI